MSSDAFSKVWPYKGKYYEAMVPDILNLQEHGRLALHTLTNNIDPEIDYNIWCRAVPIRNPIVMFNNYSLAPHFTFWGKFLEALPFSSHDHNYMSVMTYPRKIS